MLDFGFIADVPVVFILNLACIEREILQVAISADERTWTCFAHILDVGFYQRKYLNNEFEEGNVVDPCLCIAT